MMRDVAIIGAGLSGLAAARHLSDEGLDVVILEKSRGTGGRAATRRIDLPDGSCLRVDHGAQFFTARDPLFQKQVEEWLARGICFEWTCGFHTWSGGSLRAPDERWKEPRFACRDGMSALGGHLVMNDHLAPSKTLPMSLHLMRNFRVREVVRDREGWTLHPVHSSSGDPVRARGLFCSAPVPQSLELIGSYFPEEQRGLLGTMAYGSCLAVMAFYENLPIRPEWKGIQVREPNSLLSWIAWDSSRRNSASPDGSVVLHASSDFSAQEGLSANEAKKVAVEKMIGAAARIAGSWLANPTFTVPHLWRYAIPLGEGVGDGFLRAASDDQLYLIGDGMQGGRIEGAWLSGCKAARDYLLRN